MLIMYQVQNRMLRVLTCVIWNSCHVKSATLTTKLNWFFFLIFFGYEWLLFIDMAAIFRTGWCGPEKSFITSANNTLKLEVHCKIWSLYGSTCPYLHEVNHTLSWCQSIVGKGTVHKINKMHLNMFLSIPRNGKDRRCLSTPLAIKYDEYLYMILTINIEVLSISNLLNKWVATIEKSKSLLL